MAHRTQILGDHQTILITLEGPVTMQDIRLAASDALRAAAEASLQKFLADVRSAHLGVSITELYDLPSVLLSLGLQRTHQLAVVHIPGSTHVQDLYFLETVFCNYGYTARLFAETEDALNWLKTSGVPPGR